MREFCWSLSKEENPDVILRLHGSGWIGHKTLLACQRLIFERGWFQGIECRFTHPDTGDRLLLRCVRVDGTAQWRPALFCHGKEVPELTGVEPPPAAKRPRSIAVVTGLTYLCMLMAVIMLPSIRSILDALYLQHADRKFVLTATEPNLPAGALTIGPQDLPPATQGQLYHAQLHATGGTPPYHWAPIKKSWPAGMTLDPVSGELTYTPPNRYDSIGSFQLQDAAGATADGAFAIVVRPAKLLNKNWPRIDTVRLPPAVYGDPYEYQLDGTGGVPPYHWEKLTGELPSGVSINKSSGAISGTPEPQARFKLEASMKEQLKAGMVGEPLRIALADQGLILSGAARISLAEEGPGWLITSGDHRYLVTSAADHLQLSDYAGYYPFTARLIDSEYNWTQDVVPWVIPFVVTAVCLLGFWNMRRWGVALYVPCIVGEIIVAAVGLLPIAIIAIVLQSLISLVGIANYGRMY